MKHLIEAKNLLSFITASLRDLTGMKNRVNKGCEGEYTDHVHAYDEYGFHQQDKSAHIKPKQLFFYNVTVLEFGCGAGTLGYVGIEQSARSVVCGDIC